MLQQLTLFINIKHILDFFYCINVNKFVNNPHLMSNTITGLVNKLNCPHFYATGFDLYLGHTQARQKERI
jgi:hypothetical protein